jgi:hypothetical protein
MIDRLGSRLAFFGRLTDDFRREPAWLGEYRILLDAPPREALYKHDGHFTFLDLPASPTAYEFELLDGLYQGRRFTKGLPTVAPVEITYDGEDEIYVSVNTVNAVTKQITFAPIAFLPPIRSGAAVLGQGGFSTTLAEALAGVDATTAVLTTVAGLAPGNLLRIVRSHCLRAKAGPYYPFPGGLTLLRLRVVEDSAEEPPLAGVKAQLTEINGVVPSSTGVAGATLRHATLGAQVFVFGTGADLEASTEARGNAVFYFPGTWPIASLTLAISRTGYVTQTVVLALVTGATTSATVKLVPV